MLWSELFREKVDKILTHYEIQMAKNLPLDVLVEVIAHKNKHKLKINKCEKVLLPTYSYFIPNIF